MRAWVSRWVCVALLGGSAVGAAPGSPSAHAVRRLIERTSGALLAVDRPGSGTAVLVGVEGELVAPVSLVQGEALKVRFKDQVLEARVMTKDEKLGLALLKLPPGDYPAANVGSARRLVRGSFLLGLCIGRDGHLQTQRGRVLKNAAVRGEVVHIQTDLGGPSTCALFNARGELVAVRRPGGSGTAVTTDAIRARLVNGERE